MTRKIIAYAAVFFLIGNLFGCGGIDYRTLEGYVRNDRCTLATEYLEKKEKKYGSNKRLLFLLDSAMVHMACGDYEKSNEYLHRAEDLSEELWTKSITRHAASFLLNDYTIPYAGEDYEKALINLLSAINYLMLDQYEDALVECRRLDALLFDLNSKYENKNVYKEDAFGRYLSGIIYESFGMLDDAFIAYYKAFQTFRNNYQEYYGTPVPSILTEDLIRIADAVKRTQEIEPYVHSYGAVEGIDHETSQNLGKMVLIHFNGKAPVKKEKRITVPTKHGPVALAFPQYVVNRPICREGQLVIEDGVYYRESGAELVEDINQIAVKNLDDRKGRIIAKEIARVVAKQVAIHAATQGINDDRDRETARLVLNIINTFFIERADTRSWRTLPGEIYLSRVFLPQGRYNVHVSFCGSGKRFLGFVNIKAGETRFLFYNTMYTY